ncbi:hypothetical protein HOV93_48830 [Planctomycetes bacterium FF15]|uniref:Uncharacterized protein n=1 Tax=Bremerella alba TaxID=980252 RepID=A0A7V9A9Q5_9BACT|nr:hypothetical protein [Bremerella alba]
MLPHVKYGVLACGDRLNIRRDRFKGGVLATYSVSMISGNYFLLGVGKQNVSRQISVFQFNSKFRVVLCEDFLPERS